MTEGPNGLRSGPVYCLREFARRRATSAMQPSHVTKARTFVQIVSGGRPHSALTSARGRAQIGGLLLFQYTIERSITLG